MVSAIVIDSGQSLLAVWEVHTETKKGCVRS